MRVVALLVILTFFTASLASEKVRYDNFQVYRVTPSTQDAVESLRNLEANPGGFSFWTNVVAENKNVDIMVPPHLKHRFNDIIRSLELDAKVYIPNVQELIDNERTKTREDGVKFDWTDYYTLEEIYAWLEDLAASNPDTVTLLNVGTTFEGRDILGVRVSFNASNKDKSVFIEGNIHAREWISSAVATFLLNEILTSTDATVRALAESHDWYVFPVVNPDGFVYTHTNDRLWRKTRVPYPPCFGADPNRNWDFHWDEGGSSNDPCSDVHNGPEAFSEPCTKSLSDFIATIGNNLQAYIAFHSYSQYMLIPYGHTSAHLDNFDELYSVGLKAVDSLAQRYGTKFTPGNIVELLYVASGGSMDWVKGVFHTPITYTFELRDTGRHGFVLPADQIRPSGEEILDALLTVFAEFDTNK